METKTRKKKHRRRRQPNGMRGRKIGNKQIGTNNCTARYRTLSGGGIGESPSLSPSPSSDYEDEDTAAAVMAAATSSMTTTTSSSANNKQQPHLSTLNSLNCNSKNKRNGNHKGAIISQKATVHHVSTLTQKSFAKHKSRGRVGRVEREREKKLFRYDFSSTGYSLSLSQPAPHPLCSFSFFPIRCCCWFVCFHLGICEERTGTFRWCEARVCWLAVENDCNEMREAVKYTHKIAHFDSHSPSISIHKSSARAAVRVGPARAIAAHVFVSTRNNRKEKI